ncbi:putative proline-rich protein 12 [Iris pallida]|uniref:Proline-rich protein 12 n=1 Tax=Iris pallida TaxID=29817 RepID=A0AAX6IIR8_IRIPA|nr:putative proline-rich protein 12 [Iris pallida]
MKNLYTKSKGKIHPSPSSATDGDVVSVLKLLPAAILVLTAALGFEDKEVVAYLMLRSINGPVTAAEDRKQLRHRPMFDCGCFDCYTSFWSRWDCSPDRETIHMAIEGFEEHLASTERKGKGKRKERREKKRDCRKKEVEKEEAPVEGPAEESKGLVGEVNASECSLTEETKAEEEMEAATESEVESPAVSGGERRGWPDVMGMFNSRLWNLWSPGM